MKASKESDPEARIVSLTFQMYRRSKGKHHTYTINNSCSPEKIVVMAAKDVPTKFSGAVGVVQGDASLRKKVNQGATRVFLILTMAGSTAPIPHDPSKTGVLHQRRGIVLRNCKKLLKRRVEVQLSCSSQDPSKYLLSVKDHEAFSFTGTSRSLGELSGKSSIVRVSFALLCETKVAEGKPEKHILSHPFATVELIRNHNNKIVSRSSKRDINKMNIAEYEDFVNAQRVDSETVAVKEEPGASIKDESDSAAGIQTAKENWDAVGPTPMKPSSVFQAPTPDTISILPDFRGDSLNSAQVSGKKRKRLFEDVPGTNCFGASKSMKTAEDSSPHSGPWNSVVDSENIPNQGLTYEDSSFRFVSDCDTSEVNLTDDTCSVDSAMQAGEPDLETDTYFDLISPIDTFPSVFSGILDNNVCDFEKM